jgi:hypothetical protein
MKAIKISSFLVFFTASLAMTGCSSLDRMGSKMDMVLGDEQASGRMAYEGQLETARRVGSMVALQFKGGQYFDVLHVTGALYPGDIVRVYEISGGYEAHLWRSTQSTSAQIDPSLGS